MEFIRKLMKPLTQARLTGWVLIVLCAVLAIVSGSRWGFNRFRYRNVVAYQGDGLLLTALVAGGVCVLAVALSKIDLSA